MNWEDLTLAQRRWAAGGIGCLLAVLLSSYLRSPLQEKVDALQPQVEEAHRTLMRIQDRLEAVAANEDLARARRRDLSRIHTDHLPPNDSIMNWQAGVLAEISRKHGITMLWSTDTGDHPGTKDPRLNPDLSYSYHGVIVELMGSLTQLQEMIAELERRNAYVGLVELTWTRKPDEQPPGKISLVMEWPVPRTQPPGSPP